MVNYFGKGIFELRVKTLPTLVLVGLPLLAIGCSNQMPKSGAYKGSSQDKALDSSSTDSSTSDSTYGSSSGDSKPSDPSETDTGSTGTEVATGDDESASAPQPVTGSPSDKDELEDGQLFKNGSYFIRNYYTQKCLMLKDQSDASGAPIVQGPCSSATAKFLLSFVDKSFYRLQNNSTQLAMQIKGQLAINEALVEQGEYRARSHQKWSIIQQDDGTVLIKSALNDRLCLDVSFGSKDDNAAIQLWRECSALGEKWVLVEAN